MNPFGNMIAPEIIKRRLSDLTDDQFKAFEALYQLEWRKTWLRRMGWINIFWGGLTLLLGLSATSMSFPKLLQILFGVLLLAQSAWAIFASSNAAMLRFAILILAAGVWNTLLGINGGFTGGALIIGVFGIAQLWWALQIYAGYQRYQKMQLTEPQTEALAFYHEVWQALTGKKFKNDPAYIELWVGQNKVGGLLLADKAVFGIKRQHLLIIRRKQDINYISKGLKPLKKRRVYGKIKLNVLLERALMKRDSFQKYVQWKGEEAVLAAAVPTTWERLPRAIQFVLMGIGGLVLFGVGLIILESIQLYIKYG